MSVELLERAISKLKELKAGAVELPWSFSEQSPSMDGRNWVIRTDGKPGIKISAHDYGHHGNVELIVALSRAVDPMLAHLREVAWLYKYANSPGPRVMEGAYAIARAILGELAPITVIHEAGK